VTLLKGEVLRTAACFRSGNSLFLFWKQSVSGPETACFWLGNSLFLAWKQSVSTTNLLHKPKKSAYGKGKGALKNA